MPTPKETKQINLTINKLTKSVYASLGNRLSTDLSDQLFLTLDDAEEDTFSGGGNANILYTTHKEYDTPETKYSEKYYTTLGTGLNGYAKLSCDNNFVGNNIFNSISANNNNWIDEISSSTVIFTDKNGISHNVSYEQFKVIIEDIVLRRFISVSDTISS